MKQWVIHEMISAQNEKKNNENLKTEVKVINKQHFLPKPTLMRYR